ncbi:hypothetical protein J7J00_14420 [Bacillus sp. ISL-4]|uniref:hypothetical protein n=1 Tax=Bacillus sp. ISL-4 TaxID=2819125 RepID=UPI001BE5A81F|nr:hypothetical protein [Bacillus sp. ISL-4]MBT2666698.1 hypothetical protein [Bacillus sp. ISL-4]MBT2672459.1 hypothetical protein [Streptomyces sp. ISL-14]
MDELVGTCVRCARNVYCTAGFLNGILLDNKKILCFNCKDILSATIKEERLEDES